MKLKMLIFLMVFILSIGVIGCSNSSSVPMNENAKASKNTTDSKSSATKYSSDSTKNSESNSNDSSDITFPNTPLDKDLEKALFGTWKIDKLLGFSYIYNDASEYPQGQKVIGDNIIITKDLFSSEGIVNYKAYAANIKNPKILIDTVYPNADTFLVYNKIYKSKENWGLNPNDVIKSITISNGEDDSPPLSFFIVNKERLILRIEATYFELKKIDDK